MPRDAQLVARVDEYTMDDPLPKYLGERYRTMKDPLADLRSRVRNLLEKAPIGNKQKNKLRNRIAKYAKTKYLRDWEYLLHSIIAEKPVIKRFRGSNHPGQALTNYKPQEVHVQFRIYQEKTEKGQHLNLSRYSRVEHNGSKFYSNKTEYALDVPKWFYDSTKTMRLDTTDGPGDFVNEVIIKTPPPHHENTDWLSRLKQVSRSRDEVAAFENACDSVDVLLEILSTSPVLRTRPSKEPLSKRKLRATLKKYFVNRALTYPKNPEASVLEDLFTRESYFVEDACMYNNIMNAWADAWNSRERSESGMGRPAKMDMTYEAIFQLTHPGVSFPGLQSLKDYPLCFDDCRPVFEYFKVSARLYDWKNCLQDQHESDPPHRLLQKILCIICRDDHAYFTLVPNKKKALPNTKQEPAETSDDPVRHYRLLRKDDEYRPYDGTAACADDLMRSPQVLELIKTKDSVRLLWTESQSAFHQAINDLFFIYGYTPNVRTGSNGNLTAFTITDPDGLVPIEVSMADFGRFSRAVIPTDLKQIHLVQEWKHRMRMCNTDENLNRYSPDHLQAMLRYKSGTPYTRFCDVKEAHAFDIIKAYTSVILKPDLFPVFSPHDHVEAYDGHEMEDWTQYIYEVQNFRPDKTFKVQFSHNRGIKYGPFLRPYLKDLKIVAFIRPSHLVPNPYRDTIHQVWSCSELSVDDQKDIINSFIGELGRSKVKYSDECIFATKEAADREGGKVYQLGRLFRVSKPTQYRLVEGYLPIQLYIYDESKRRLAELINEVGEDHVLAVHTDSIMVPKTLKDIPAHWFQIEKNNPDFFGKIHDDGIKQVRCREFEYQTNDYVAEPYQKPKATVYSFENEWDLDQYFEILLEHDSVFIKGLFPGVGKTFLAKAFVKWFFSKRRKEIKDAKAGKYQVACPTNSQACEHKHGLTLYKLCGKVVVEKEGVKRSAITGLDLVVMEECGMYSDKEWRMANEYTRKHPCKVIWTGDHRQIEPVDLYWNPLKNRDKWFDDMMNEVAPVHIELKIIKRLKDPKQQERLEDLFKDFFERDTPRADIMGCFEEIQFQNIPAGAVCICNSNAVKDYANEKLHKHPEKYYPGQKLIKYSDGKLTQNDHHIYKRCVVEVLKYEDKEVRLKDNQDHEYEFDDVRMSKNFDYYYALTGHGAQGRTFDGPVVVFETESNRDYVSRNWLWVALTRCTDLTKVFWCKTPVKAETDKVNILRSIKRYMTQDRNAKRIGEETPKDYIDVDWWVQTRKAQNNKCYLCGEVMLWKNKDHNPRSCTVDRFSKDPGLYHSKTNSRLACYQCNTKKKNKDYQEDDDYTN